MFWVSANYAKRDQTYPYPAYTEAFKTGRVVMCGAGKRFVKLAKFHELF